MRAAIRDTSGIVLIVAVKSKKRNNFVKKLVNRMSPEDLAQGDRDKRTALHWAVVVGNMEAAKLLVEKNRYLLVETNTFVLCCYSSEKGDDEALPKNTHLPQFWPHSPSNANHSSPSYQKPYGWNPTPFKGEPGFRILHQLILSEFCDIALALVRDKPELAIFIPNKEDHLEYLSLMAISQKPSSF
ncbi:hypothetical protein ACSBR2_007255 [Camellia fascicularis]